MLGITTTNARVGGYRGGISAEAKTIYNRIIADGGVSNLTRLNFFVKGLKAIYGDLANVPVCYDAHWIGYKLGSGTGATAGQAAAKLYSLQGNIQGDAPNKYWVGSGVTNNFCQSNTSTYNTNDIDIEVKAFTSATTGDINFINISNGTSTTVDFFYSKTSNAIAFQYYTGGFRSAFSVTTIADGDIFRVTRNATTGSIVFKKNGTTIPTSGSQVAGVLDYTNTTIKIGQGLCKIYYANFYISGVLNKEFNPNLYTGANTWASATSEVWTINSTGAGLADAVQTTAASQPLLLSHNGASSDNYWWGSGVSGNYVSTPNAAANQITGDIEIIVKANINNDATNQAFVAKYLSSSQFLLRKNSSNFIQFIGSKISGAEDINGTSTATISSGIKWVKVTRQASSGNMYFYTSPDGVAYTQLGSMVSTTSGNLVNGTDPINVGVFSTTGNPYLGGIYRLTISNSIGGTPVVDFNPATYNAATSQTAWTSTTGEIWTISTGTATTGYKGVLVDRTIVQTDGIDDNLVSSTFGTITDRTNYVAFISWVSTNANYLMDGSTGASNGLITGNTDKIGIITNAANATIATYTQQRKLSTTKLSANVQGAAINNGAETTLTIVAPFSFTSVVIGRTAIGTAPMNMCLNTLVISNLADNSTNRTSMYNLIRSLNNNAF